MTLEDALNALNLALDALQQARTRAYALETAIKLARSTHAKECRCATCTPLDVILRDAPALPAPIASVEMQGVVPLQPVSVAITHSPAASWSPPRWLALSFGLSLGAGFYLFVRFLWPLIAPVLSR